MEESILTKIAFWSNAKENSGVTSNLACISIASTMEHSHKAILMENHHQINKLENILMYRRKNYHICAAEDYHNKRVGIDYLINQISNRKEAETKEQSKNQKIEDNISSIEIESKSQETSKSFQKISKPIEEISKSNQEASRWIEEASVAVLGESLYYIPPSDATNNHIFDYDLYDNINSIMDALESFADVAYIDTSNRNNLSSKIILDEVDLVVVNLVQNSSMINHFFENYSSILSKCVFLISSYHKESKLNINKISKTHLISKSNIATIPYNFEYQEAVCQGTVVEFLSRNYFCKRTNPNYNFVIEVKKAVYMITIQLEYISCKEECL
jgi:hypothetical protein